MTEQGHGYALHWTTPDYLAKVRMHVAPYEVDVFGVPVIVLPKVMSPRYDWAGLFMIERLPADLSGRQVLEIGPGCGLVSVHALLRGAQRLVAADINPEAVRNTALNLERNGFRSRAKVLESDVFDAVDGRFDLVIFNAPYHGCDAADLLERGVADPGYQSLRRFFQGVSDVMKPDGTLLFGFSESGDLALARSLIRKAGLNVRQQFTDMREGYQCMVFELTNSDA